MKNIKIEKFLFNKVLIFLVFFLIISSTCYLNFNYTIKTIVLCSSYTISAFIIISYFFRFKFNRFSISIIIFMLLLLISTYMGQNASIWLYISTYIRILAVILFLDWSLEKKSLNTYKGMNVALFIIIVINFVTIIAYPNGIQVVQNISNNWFVGYDNTHIFIYLPALLISRTLHQHEKNNIISMIIYYIEFLLITISVYKCFSAATVFVYTLLILYLIFNKKINKLRVLNIKVFETLYYVIFFGIVVLRFQNFFNWLIVDILNKDITFTGRTIIWDRIIEHIKIKPIIGYGLEKQSYIALKLGSLNFTHAHNTIYDILYKGGFISLIAFSYYQHAIVKFLSRFKNNIYCKYYSIIILGMFILMNFEAREDKIGLFIMFTICSKFNYLFFINNKEEKQNV